jgi:two-component system repressor protein LuxO
MESGIGRGSAPPLLHASNERTQATTGSADFEGFVGRSERMRGLYAQIRAIARSSAPVFITGESGTGKELCADAVHKQSHRAGTTMVSLNCSAIPKELMESEIFGHVKGAFTGASEARAGAAELADGGTLFLDEICEMDLALQSKLLRFIQSGTFRRVGDAKPRCVDVRFVCATNRDPAEEVRAGRFREDLYYRLHVIPVRLPALRERREDILALAEAFLAAMADEEGAGFGGFTAEAADMLRGHSWPGNVRQLQNVIRRIVVLNDGELIDAELLRGPLREQAPCAPVNPAATAPATAIGTAGDGGSDILPLWRQERAIIEDAVHRCGGSIGRAARALEISPSTIYRKLQSWQEFPTAGTG